VTGVQTCALPICNLPSAAPVPADRLWDGRFRIAADFAGTVAPWGREAAVPADLPPGISPALAKAALATLPCATGAGEPASLVHARLAAPAPGPWSRFLPSWDLAAADAAARLLGIAAPPAAPAGLNPALADA